MSIQISVMLEGHFVKLSWKDFYTITYRQREREHIINEKEEKRRIEKEGGKEEEALKKKQRKREQEREGGIRLTIFSQ